MKPPVFVLGFPRSGTTLLYSMLIAAGGFAVYRKETYFYDLVPRFGSLQTPHLRDRFLHQWLNGYLGKVPGLDLDRLARKAMSETRHRREFLPRLMDAIATAQQAHRWVEATPAHLLYINEIRKAVPHALVLHVIRDGRDCALSYERQGWLSTLPWDRGRRVGVAALFWEWMVRNGRARGRLAPDRYREVRFESLVTDPRAALQEIGRFIDHDLDYDRMQQNPVHSLRKPNTSFREERKRGDFNPVGRWQARAADENVQLCEALVGPFLRELGYALSTSRTPPAQRLRARAMRAFYLPYFASKHSLKARTPLGRLLTNTSVWDEQPRGAAPAEPVPQPDPHADNTAS